jgi:hypothetical protein
MITSITERNLVRKSDNQPFTLFDFETQPMGKMSTSKRELKEQGSVLVGAPVTIQYSEKPGNPGYPPNRYIEKITPAPQQPFPQGAALTTADPFLPPNSGAAVAQQAQQSLQNVAIGRDEAIWRQTASKTAASFNNATLAEYWERVGMLLDFYRTGIIPGVEAAEEQPPPLPVVEDDDIPF